MSFKYSFTALVMATVMVAPAATWGGGAGGPGCTNLPLYNRALGALQGMTSACDMTVQEARRIIDEHNSTTIAPRQVAPKPEVPRQR